MFQILSSLDQEIDTKYHDFFNNNQPKEKNMVKKTKKEALTENKIEVAQIVLRAFKISNPNATTATSQVREKLEAFLESDHSAEQRCLVLNPDDTNKEQDLISDYSSKGKDQSLFCTLL